MPGLPGILIGHNARIAWSLTDTQNQATLFYDEQTSAPGRVLLAGPVAADAVAALHDPGPRGAGS